MSGDLLVRYVGLWLVTALLLMVTLAHAGWANTHTFNTAADADNQACESSNDASYPPAFSDCYTGDPEADKDFGFGTYYIDNAFMRWTDGGNLLVGSTINSATLTVCISAGNVNNADSRNLDCEWYPNWTTLGVGDYTSTGGITALAIPLTSLIGSGSFPACTDNVLALTSPDANIQKGGTTALRCTISGGQPGGNNNVYTIGHATNAGNAPRLTVDYTFGGPTDTPSDTPAPTPTRTPTATGSTATPTPTLTATPQPTLTAPPGCTIIPAVAVPSADELQTDSNCQAYPPVPDLSAPEHICYNDTFNCDMTIQKNDCSSLADASQWAVRVGFLRLTYSLPPGSTITSASLNFANNRAAQNAASDHDLLLDYIADPPFCSFANWNPSGPGAAGSLSVASIIANGVGAWNAIPLTDTSGLTDTGGAFRFTISGQGTPQGTGRDQADVEVSNECRFGAPSLLLCVTPGSTSTPTTTPTGPTSTPSPTGTRFTPTTTPTPTVTPTRTISPTPTPFRGCCPCPTPFNAICSGECPAPCGPPLPNAVCQVVH